MMGRLSKPPHPGLGAAILLAVGCAWPRPPAAVSLACSEPCASLQEMSPPASATVQLEVAAGTLLHDVRLRSGSGPPCGEGVSVRVLEVDGRPYRAGPAPLARASVLRLRFIEDESDEEQTDALSLRAPLSLDLALRTGSDRHCLPLAIPEDDQRWLLFRYEAD